MLRRWNFFLIKRGRQPFGGSLKGSDGLGHVSPTEGAGLYREEDEKVDGRTELEQHQAVEAILFLAKEPLTTEKITKLAGLESGRQGAKIVKKLKKKYDENGRSFTIEAIAGGYRLLTRRKFHRWILLSGMVSSEKKLSTPAMESLAIIAYKQPVTRPEIEAIRGVDCGDILKQLLERKLVKIVGKSTELGRPYLYGTTKKFLSVFGLKNIEKLPKIEESQRESLEA